MSARSAVTRSFLATSVLGFLFVFGYWLSRDEPERGLLRAVGFVGAMWGVHSLGDLVYRHQADPGASGEASVERIGRASSGLATAYLDGFRPALVEQVLCLGLSALMLDGGRLFRLCGVAALAYCALAVLIVGRRPASPTRFDLVLIRHGSLILLPVTGWMASLL